MLHKLLINHCEINEIKAGIAWTMEKDTATRCITDHSVIRWLEAVIDEIVDRSEEFCEGDVYTGSTVPKWQPYPKY